MDGNGGGPKKRLRDYQEKALEAIEARLAAGIRTQLLSAATGAGKTIIFAELIKRRMRQGKNALVLAHRDRLIQQSAEKIAEVVGPMQIGIVNAQKKEWWSNCVVATVQSAIVEEQLNRAPQFDTIVVDEAHRAGGASYAKVIEKLLKPDGLLLGVTATPNRGDKLALIPGVFEEMVFQIGMQQLIDEGHLCQVVGTEIKLPIDISKLRSQVSTEGIKDFRADDVQRAFQNANWLESITAGWRAVASDRRTIVFVPPGLVNERPCGMAHTLAEYMAARGIRAAAVDGTTPQWQQDQVIRDFTDGRLQVLVNVNIFCEGLDIPPIDCVLFARLTQSSIIYSQSVGRGTRLFPGKKDCLVIDVTGMTEALADQGQTLMTLGRILPNEEQIADLHKQRIARARRLLRKLRHGDVLIKLMAGDIFTRGLLKKSWQRDLEELRPEVILCLEQEQLEDADKQEKERERRAINTQLLYHDGDGLMVRTIDPGKAGINFQWHYDIPARTATFHHRGLIFKIERPHDDGPYIASGPSWRSLWPTGKQAKEAAENHIVDLELEWRKRQVDEKKKKAIFDDPQAKWRKKPVSDAQKALALKMFVSLPPDCTMGQASDLINAKKAQREQRKAAKRQPEQDGPDVRS